MADPDKFLDDDRRLRELEWQHIVNSWKLQEQKKGRKHDQATAEAAFGHELEDLRGLALSGGGIRSAAFSIGALQALNKAYALSRVHYLSTVSGGGYAGTALTWFFRGNTQNNGYDTAKRFPLSTVVENKDGMSLIETLRFKASYLDPGVGLSKLALAGVVLRSVFLSVTAYLTILTALMFVLVPALLESGWHKTMAGSIPSLGFLAAWNLAAVLAAAALVAIALWYLLSNLAGALLLHNFVERRMAETRLPILIGSGLALAALALLPQGYALANWIITTDVDGFLSNAGKTAAALSPVLAIGGSLVSSVMMKDAAASQKNIMANIVLWISAAILCAALAVGSYGLMKWVAAGLGHWQGFAAVAVAAFVVGAISNINYSALHRFYRDRLMEAFLPNAAGSHRKAGRAPDADSFDLSQACAMGDPGPLHLINCNAVLTSSRDDSKDYYRSRGGDSFTLSPLYCGGDATGWMRTNCWISDDAKRPALPFRLLSQLGLMTMRRMTLATAMAISGAAVNPRTTGQGLSRSGLLSFVTTLLNIRLGYWVPNPRAQSGAAFADRRPWHAWYPPNFLHPGILGGLFASYKYEKARWIEITDGGHFDNIGIYELARRRVRNLIVIDGTADPGLKLESFANAYERARNDFGMRIDISNYPINFNDMMPNSARPSGKIKDSHALAERGWAVGKLTYDDDAKDAAPGFIFYVNTVLTERLPANLYSYHSAHPDFPDEPTSDQFFDEHQFEAYRELGMEITWDMMRSVALYDDLARAVGLVPSEGERLLQPSKTGGVESPHVLEALVDYFPGEQPLSRKTYPFTPERLDLPAEPPATRPADASAAAATPFARKVTKSKKSRRG